MSRRPPDKHPDLGSEPTPPRAAAPPRSFEPPEKKATKCMGPQVVLELEPKTCEIDPAAKVIACTPARLVLRKVPGECTLKRITPASWTGKECKVTITVRLSIHLPTRIGFMLIYI